MPSGRIDSIDCFLFTLKDYGYAVTSFKTFVNDVVIPKLYSNGPVVELGDSLFLNQNIVSVFIPNTVTYIACDVFNGCKMLEKVTFEENSLLNKLDIRVFAWCSALKYIDIPQTLQTIKAYDAIRLIVGVDSLTCISYLGKKSFNNPYFIQEYNQNLQVHVLPSYTGVFGHFKDDDLIKDGKTCEKMDIDVITKPFQCINFLISSKFIYIFTIFKQ